MGPASIRALCWASSLALSWAAAPIKTPGPAEKIEIAPPAPVSAALPESAPNLLPRPEAALAAPAELAPPTPRDEAAAQTLETAAQEVQKPGPEGPAALDRGYDGQARQAASAEGWVGLSDLAPGERYVSERLGPIVVDSVEPGRLTYHYEHDPYKRKAALLNPSPTESFAAHRSPAAQAATEARIRSHFLRPENIPLAFAVDTLRRRAGLAVTRGVIKPQSPELLARYQEILLGEGLLKPGENLPEALRKALTDVTAHPETVARLRAMTEAVSEATGEDLVRTGLLATARESLPLPAFNGAGSLMGGGFKSAVQFSDGSGQSWVQAWIAKLPMDLVKLLRGRAWDAAPGPRSAPIASRDYYPTGDPRHGSDDFSQKLLALKREPSRELAEELVAGAADALSPLREELLRRRFRTTERPLILPVPSSGQGPLLLAQALAARLEGPVDSSILVKKKGAKSQHDLGFDGRLENAAGAFKLDPKTRASVKNKTIILVDDVYTTGATAEAARALLLEAGAKEVRVVALGRTAPADSPVWYGMKEPR